MTRRRSVYLDNAAATPVDQRVFEAMWPYFYEHCGNPSALYSEAQISNSALDDSRRTIAEILRARPGNIIFTSGGTESNNLAIFGVARAHVKHGKHIITVAAEHHSVLEPLVQLKKEGWKITILPVDKNGFIKTEDVVKTIRPDTTLISIMYANNEIGAIQPIAEIGRQISHYRKEKGSAYPFFHSDACQSYTKTTIDVKKFNLDFLTLNAHKIHGPKGVGALYVRQGVKLEPLLHGGGQEFGTRSSTENVAGIMGFAKAVEIASKSNIKKMTELRDDFIEKILKLGNVKLNGPTGESRLCNNINLAFFMMEGEQIQNVLSQKGIFVSTGSACSSGSHEVSHVMRAIKCPMEYVHGNLRISLSKFTTKEELNVVLDELSRLLVDSKLKLVI